MSNTSSAVSLRDEARSLRMQREANAQKRRIEQVRLDRFRSAVEARGDAVRRMLWALDRFNTPPSTAELDAHCNTVAPLLADALVALREADRLSKLEALDESATCAHYRQVRDDPREQQITFRYGRQMIEADPNDRQRLAELVRGAVQEPGLRRAWEWSAILLKGLADEQKLCWKEPESTAQLGLPSLPVSDESGAPKAPLLEPADGVLANDSCTGSSWPQNRTKDGTALGRTSDCWPRLEDWALAIEYPDAWHVFRRYGNDWRLQRRATGIKKGRQEDLLTRFAKGSGLLTDDEAVQSVRQTFSKDDNIKIMKIIKPEISRLRRVIRSNLRIAGGTVDPLPRDKRAKAWQARIQIGYALKNDEDRLEFKLSEHLSREEAFDV